MDTLADALDPARNGAESTPENIREAAEAVLEADSKLQEVTSWRNVA